MLVRLYAKVYIAGPTPDGLYDRIKVDWGGWAYRCSKDYFSEKLIAGKHLEDREIAVLDVELW